MHDAKYDAPDAQAGMNPMINAPPSMAEQSRTDPQHTGSNDNAQINSLNLACTEPSYPSAAAIAAVNQQNALAAAGPGLLLLERQLLGVNDDVLSSVASVCSGFKGIAQRASEAVAAARQATVVDNVEEGQGNATVEIQRVLQLLLAGVRSSSEFSQNATQRLNVLEQKLARTERILGEVEEIADRAKMVALNGRIEASRLGESGKAMGVIASETKDLAERAAQTSRSIRQSISELGRELAQTTHEMEEQSASHSNDFESASDQVSKLLTNLEQSHQHLLSVMSQTATVSVALQNDIAKAVMSMQFQDRVSQRIAHVAEAIKAFVQTTELWLGDERGDEVYIHLETWLNGMQDNFTMDSERDLAAKTLPRAWVKRKLADRTNNSNTSRPSKSKESIASVELF